MCCKWLSVRGQQDTSGHFKPSVSGGTPSESRRLRNREISQCVKQFVSPDEFLSSPVKFVSRLCFCLFSLFVIGVGKIYHNRKGHLYTALYLTCSCHTKYTPLAVTTDCFLKHECTEYTKQHVPSKNDLTLDTFYLKWKYLWKYSFHHLW